MVTEAGSKVVLAVQVDGSKVAPAGSQVDQVGSNREQEQQQELPDGSKEEEEEAQEEAVGENQPHKNSKPQWLSSFSVHRLCDIYPAIGENDYDCISI